MSTPSPWQYFTMEELTCRCGCGRMEMDPEFMRVIVGVRRETGIPFKVTSGFRCENHPDEQKKKNGPGPHNRGRAIDIATDSHNAVAIIQTALNHGIEGVGVSLPNGKHDAPHFIHLDKCGRRMWSY